MRRPTAGGSAPPRLRRAGPGALGHLPHINLTLKPEISERNSNVRSWSLGQGLSPVRPRGASPLGFAYRAVMVANRGSDEHRCTSGVMNSRVGVTRSHVLGAIIN